MTAVSSPPPPPSRQSFGLVVPTYGRPRFVRDAVDSAVAQTRPFDRIVVVLDGDQPDTRAALEGAPVEVSAARNAGIAFLDTDWVCFLDDDDLLHPEYLSTYTAGLTEFPDVRAANTRYLVMGARPGPDVDFVAHDYASAVAALPGVSPTRPYDYMHIHGESFDRLLERMRGSLSGSAVRRDLLQRTGGFPEELRCAEDWTMYVNVARLTEWGTNPTPLVIFREHDQSSGTAHGGSRNGLDTLRAVRSFWAPTDLPTPAHRPLRAYREDYRYILRWTLDVCRLERDRAAYREAVSIARSILPRRWDRILARVPERTWEWTRARFGRRRISGGSPRPVSG
jgi:glycosyltransferase involved in cell wall biosynthesis